MTLDELLGNPELVQKMIDEYQNQQNNDATAQSDSATDPAAAPQCTIAGIMRDNLDWIQGSGLFNAEQIKAAQMIGVCKTSRLGGVIQYCPDCKRPVSFQYRSCNNRNCPYCQFPLQKKWVELRKSEAIPGTPYYHVILTVPHLLNPLILENQKILLDVLFQSTSKSILEMCQDERILGAKPGFFTTLHSWSSDMNFHFHTHTVLSGGGLNDAGVYVNLIDLRKEQAQKSAKAENDASVLTDEEAANRSFDYFMPVVALTDLFRGKYMDALKKLYDANKLQFPAELDYLSDPHEWSTFCGKLYQTKWVGKLVRTCGVGENAVGVLAQYCNRLPGQNITFCQESSLLGSDSSSSTSIIDISDATNGSYGDAFDYLSRYVFHTALTDNRLLDYDTQSVSFLARDPENGNMSRKVTYPVHRFIQLFLGHILPKGYTRVRFYGFLACGQKKRCLNIIFMQVTGAPFEYSELKQMHGLPLMQKLFPKAKYGICPDCGGALVCIPFDKARKYDASARARARARSAPAA